jgi:ankyrin repeat protein
VEGARRGQKQVVQTALDYGADLNYSARAEYRDLVNPLESAALYGDEDLVMYLLSRGANARKCTALTCATKHGSLNISRILLAHGADVNMIWYEPRFKLSKLYRRQTHVTSWSAAIHYNHVRLLQLFLNNGADLRAHPEITSAAYSHACSRGDRAIVRILRGHEVMPDGTVMWIQSTE